MTENATARRPLWRGGITLLLVLAAGFGARAHAQGLTLEQAMSFPFPDNLASSAHGERIAWVFNQKGLRNVWVADGPGFRDARPVTRYDEDDGRPIASVRLTPGGRTVVFARGSELSRAGQVADPNNLLIQPVQRVYAVDVDSGAEPRLLGTLECQGEGCEDIEISPNGQMAAWAARGQIWVAPLSGSIPAQSIGYVRGQNSQPRWSPDSRKIAFQSNRGDHSFIALFDFASRSLAYMHPSFDRDILPRWSPDGTKIAFVRLHGIEARQPLIPLRPEPWSIWVGDPATGAAHPIWRSGDTLDDSYDRLRESETFQFTAGDRLLFASEMDGWNHLYTIPAAGGQPTALTPGQYEVKDVTLGADGQSVLYSSNENDVDRRHIWRVPASGGTPVALTRGETIEWTPVETGDGKYDLCLGSTATSPAMPYLIASPGRQIIAGQFIADYPSSQLVTPRQVIFKSADGLEIHGQLFVPGNRSGRGPALVWMHGGPIRQMMLGFPDMDYYHYAYAENQYLVSLGFEVLSVNYRTGIMYGRAFREPPNAGWRGAAEYQEIVAAAKFLQAQPGVDPDKIGLWGGSYGGYLTAMGLARNSDIFKAGVDMHGVHDWSARMSAFASYFFGGGAGPAPDQAQAMKLAFESSPDASVGTWKSPVLLIQGDDDRNVDFSQSVDLTQRLRQNHVPFEQLVFPDEIHGFLMWKSWMRAYAATADFFVRVLMKGEAIATTN
ncbi:MAG TPA: prolyl oligopeptidase family serine peptidase [Candidatus Acidoferrales bacterium]|nr:prolyl oligopeptidase family serine peptidase [Candidatus Acidoferrales bacterium]